MHTIKFIQRPHKKASICGVCKGFSEHYQINKRYKQMLFISLQSSHQPLQSTFDICIASGNYQQRLPVKSTQNCCNTIFAGICVHKTFTFHSRFQAGKQEVAAGAR